MMAMNDPTRRAMKEAIRKTLLKFDSLSKALVNKDYKNSEPLVFQLKEQLRELERQKSKLQDEFNRLEEDCRKLILENPEGNKKRIKKLYQKLDQKVSQNTKCISMMKQIQEKLSQLKNNPLKGNVSIADLKKQYQTTFEIIQDFRQSLPDVYQEVEKETGIYFFMPPK
ncbi:MAG: hypothetical protein ACTSYS_07865 [Promethearchaeota archaeon]